MKKMKRSVFLSIVIPVFNSEKTIKIVVDKITKVLSGHSNFEIILVNDGSIDNSSRICLVMSQRNKNVRFLDLSRNFGQHNAIMAGLNYCSGEYIICMDDDLQTPPEEIWKLINKLEEGYDVVFSKYKDKKHSIGKRIGSKINSIMLNLLINKPADIYLSSFFIMKKFLAKEIIKNKESRPYIWGYIIRNTNNIGNVEVIHKKRSIGKTNYSFIKLTQLFFNGFINFSIKPLRILLVIGFFLGFVSIILIFILFIQKINDPNIPTGWTSTMIVIIFFSGLNLVSIGLVGEYVGRGFLIHNKQPQYLIRNKANTENGKKS